MLVVVIMIILWIYLLTKELQNFKSTIFFFLPINSYNIVISFLYHKWGSQDPEKLVDDTKLLA